jgi:hypothetical protein
MVYQKLSCNGPKKVIPFKVKWKAEDVSFDWDRFHLWDSLLKVPPRPKSYSKVPIMIHLKPDS